MNNLDATFSALADPTRRAILARLASSEATVGELSRPFDITPPAISRHLRVLEHAQLIKRERRGQHQVCRLEAQGLADANAWLERYRQFWTDAFEQLDQHLKSKGTPK